ncbi:MAG: type III pantothenate kinase, partial [Betaproteobacteria bacterium]|nr:type III pantothenate kinase [Betaproteobacteria bacterium]
MSLLLLDLGNTRLKWGVCESLGDAATTAHGAMPLEAIETLADDLRTQVSGLPRVAVGCAVAGAVATMRVEAQLARVGLRCHWMHSVPQQCGVRNGYTTPSMLGADRWAALIGARLRHPQQAVLIISVGTAVT